MNTLLDLLSDLRQKDVKLWADGTELRLSAPPGVLTPALIGALRERKAELLAALRPSEATPAPSAPQRVPRGGTLPASFGQQQLWVLDQLGYGTAYSMAFATKLEGRLDLGALQRALDEIVQRHESLRTTFAQVDGKVQQIIHPVQPVALSTLDLRTLDPAACAAAVEELVPSDLERPFNLTRDPMLRARLLSTGEVESILILTLHHISSDGWSMGVLTRELSALYTAFAADAPSPLPELPIQYADFALWQRGRLQGEALESELRFWQEQLRGAPPFLNLPISVDMRTNAPSTAPPRGARLTFSLDAKTTRGLQRLGREAGATLFMTLLAAFQILLSRYSGQEDLLVGTPVANRTHRALEPMIGYFVNTLVLRAELGDNPTFLDFLSRVQKVTLLAYEHQDLPFERLVEALAVERVPHRNPLVQVLFGLQNAAQVDLALPGIKGAPIDLPTRTARMDLEVDVLEEGDHLKGFWVYNRDRFEAAAMERMVGHFQTLLAGVVADPTRRIGDLPLLSSSEQRQILVEWNDTAADLPREGCIHRLFEAQVERTPDAIAVVHDRGSRPESLTYRALNEQSNQLAHHLRALGVGPETLVGLCVERSLSMVVGMLGVLKVGGAYIPLDPALPPDRLAFLLRDTRAPVVLTQAHLLARLPAHDARVIPLDAEGALLSAHPTHNPVSDAASNHLAYVMYTSGSTGQPKGVLIEHHALLAHSAHYVRFHGLTPADRVLALASFHFDASVEQIFPALIAGARVILPEWELEPRIFSQKLAELGLTIVDTSGAHWRALVEQWLKTPALLEGMRVRTLIIGGDVMPAEVIARWQKTPLSARACLFNVYGPTETTVAATAYEVPRDFDVHRVRIPIGRPLANRTAYVLDRHQRPVPVGVPGELYLGGVGPARGYLNQPALTQDKFITLEDLPSAPGLDADTRGCRVYRTGDLCRWLADGTLDFLGRVDNQVKIRGYRVELGEIEAHLRQHPAVRDAVVIVHDANHHRSLVGYVVPANTLASEGELGAELNSALRRTLPEHMVPSRFVLLGEIPRVTTSGKVDKAALPNPALTGGAAELVAPRSPTEETLTSLWCDVLGRPRVGIHDNFFEVGGHSLLGTQVISRVNQTFSIQLPLQAIFEHPTVAELAAAIEGTLLALDMLASEGSGAAPKTANVAAAAGNEAAEEDGEL